MTDPGTLAFYIIAALVAASLIGWICETDLGQKLFADKEDAMSNTELAPTLTEGTIVTVNNPTSKFHGRSATLVQWSEDYAFPWKVELECGLRLRFAPEELEVVR